MMKKYYILLIIILISCQPEKQVDKGYDIDLEGFNLSKSNEVIQLDTSVFAQPMNIIAKLIENIYVLNLVHSDQRCERLKANDLIHWVINYDSLNPPEYNYFRVDILNRFDIRNENYWEDKFLVYFASKLDDRRVKYFAVGKDYNIYFLDGFGIDDINKLVKFEIGKISNDTLAYKLARFNCCFSTLEMFPVRIVDHSNYDSLKNIYKTKIKIPKFDKVQLPKLTKYKDRYEFEIYSIGMWNWFGILKNNIIINENGIVSERVDTLLN